MASLSALTTAPSPQTRASTRVERRRGHDHAIGPGVDNGALAQLEQTAPPCALLSAAGPVAEGRRPSVTTAATASCRVNTHQQRLRSHLSILHIRTFRVGVDRSSDRGLIGDHLRRKENQQLGPLGRSWFYLEKIAEVRHVSQQRHLLDLLIFVLFKDPADHNGSPVLYKHLRLNGLRVDRRNAAEDACRCCPCSLRHVMNDIALGRDLRRDFQLQGPPR